jgi:hypothetical protein
MMSSSKGMQVSRTLESRPEGWHSEQFPKSANAILPHLGAIVLDQLGSMDEGERIVDAGFPGMPRSGSSLSINAIQVSNSSVETVVGCSHMLHFWCRRQNGL